MKHAITTVTMLASTLLGGCVGSMPCQMLIQRDGDTVYQATITIIETDRTLAEVWQRTGKPGWGLPLIANALPDPASVNGKTSLLLEGDITVTLDLDRTPLLHGPHKLEVSLDKLELVRDAVTDDAWYLPSHQVQAIQERLQTGK